MAWSLKDEWKKAKELLSSPQTVVVYDLETTGLSPARDRFIELGAIKYFVHDNVWEKKGELSLLVNPERPLEPKITEITGLTDADLMNEPTEADIFGDVCAFFDGCIIAGYNNTRFDDMFFKEYYSRRGLMFEPVGSIDGYLLAKQSGFYSSLENCKLTTIGTYYGLNFTAHRALGDVMTTAEILRIMLQQYAEQDEVDANVVTSQFPARVTRVSFWAGFRGFSRIYCETSRGTVYYDLRSTLWGGKDVNVETLDMADIQKQAFALTNASTLADFAKFKDSVTL